MKLIVGLGNPGKEYALTRHNIGFMILDALADDWKLQKQAQALIHKDNEMLFVKPQTFMNQSGTAVAMLKKMYGVAPEDIWIIHDDSDLALGRIKIARGGSSAGHKGVQSIYDALKIKTVVRFKIGIRPMGMSGRAERFVLKLFRKNERKTIASVIHIAAQAVLVAREKNITHAMNLHNGTTLPKTL